MGEVWREIRDGMPLWMKLLMAALTIGIPFTIILMLIHITR